jgi:excisionase family DNA binding protein
MPLWAQMNRPAVLAEETLSVVEVARILGCSVDTVRRHADAGLLPSWRLPSGHRRFAALPIIDMRDGALGTADETICRLTNGAA